MFKKLLLFSFFASLIFIIPSCLLKKYIYTDEELEEHYKNSSLKPVYKFVNFNGKKLHYAVMSKSDTLPLLVFVHGAPGAWYGYMNLMEDSLLQKKFKMVSVDRLGYGKSNYGTAELSTQMQALSIKEVIEKENYSGKKVTLFGRSYGAPVAASLAIQYPQQVSKLFMISPVIDPDKEKFYWFSGMGTWKVVQWMLPKMLNVATEEKYAHSCQMKAMLPRWKKLYVPTVVVTGENDQIADTANFTFAKKCLINCDTTLVKVPGAGHLVTYERPTLVKKLLLN